MVLARRIELVDGEQALDEAGRDRQGGAKQGMQRTVDRSTGRGRAGCLGHERRAEEHTTALVPMVLPGLAYSPVRRCSQASEWCVVLLR